LPVPGQPTRLTGPRAGRNPPPNRGVRQPRPRKWDLLLVCAAVYLVTAVARLHALVPGATALRPVLLSAGVGLIVYAFRAHGIRSPLALKHPLALAALFLIVWATLGAPVALYPGKAVRFLFDELYKVGFLMLLVAGAPRDLNDVKRLLMVYAAGAITYAFLAATPGRFRALGGGGYDANDAAMLVVSALPVVAYFLLRARTWAGRLFFGLGLVACSAAVVTSGSRGGFLAFIAVVLYMVFFFQGVKPIIRGAAVGLMLAVFVFSAGGDYWERMDTLRNLDEDYNTQSITGRKQVWKRGVGYALANPVLGVGVSNFSVAEGRHPAIASRIERGRGTVYRPAHSMWVDAGAELGFPGFLAFVSLFLMALYHLARLGRQARRNRSPPAIEAAGMAGAIMGMVIALMVGGTFLSQAYGYAVWGTLGLVLGLLKVVRAHGLDPRRPRSRQRAMRQGPRMTQSPSWGSAS
jgi:putative inorganic carbon (hco3(-)) transporter